MFRTGDEVAGEFKQGCGLARAGRAKNEQRTTCLIEDFDNRLAGGNMWLFLSGETIPRSTAGFCSRPSSINALPGTEFSNTP
jgi:hypothetical protein